LGSFEPDSISSVAPHALFEGSTLALQQGKNTAAGIRGADNGASSTPASRGELSSSHAVKHAGEGGADDTPMLARGTSLARAPPKVLEPGCGMPPSSK